MDVQLRPNGTDCGNHFHQPIQFFARIPLSAIVIVLRPFRADQTTLWTITQTMPEFLGNEGHDGMQHRKGHAKYVRSNALYLALFGAIRAVQDGLGEFEKPVTEEIPSEAINSARIIIEAETFQRDIRLSQGRIGRIQNPAREWQLGRSRIKPGHRRNAIHFAKPRRIPDFGGKGPIAFHPLPAKFDISPRACQGAEREAHRIRAIGIQQFQGINAVAARFGHFLPFFIAHQAMDANGLEGNPPIHEMNAHHHHSGDPEKDDIRSRDQNIAGIVFRKLRRFFRPANRGKRPKRAGKPGIQHILITRQRHRMPEFRACGCLSFFFGMGDENLAIRGIPGGDLMPPPKLARNAPGLDIAHPGEEGVFPLLGREDRLPCFHRPNCGGSECLGIHIPLHRQARFNRHARPITMRHHMRVRLDLLDQFQFLKPRHNRLARGEAILPRQPAHKSVIRNAISGSEMRADFFQHHAPFGIQHGWHGQIMAPPDLKIIEVMRGRDLDRAGALFWIGIFIRHHRNGAAQQRQDHALADQILEARIIGMHGNGRITQHGLWPRGRHHQEAPRRTFHRVAQIPQTALHFLAFDFQIGNRRQEFRVPIHEPSVTIDQALGVQRHEYFAHCGRKPFIHREAFTWPIERCTKPAQLPRDGAARFRLPFPNALQKSLAPHAAAVWLFLFGQ